MQENTKRTEELDVLYKAKTKLEKEKQDMETKLNEIKTDCDKLQKEVHCQVQLLVVRHTIPKAVDMALITINSKTKANLKCLGTKVSMQP